MYIESLELKNYRNYESLSMDFEQGINILYGDNAQGKTNILEALYLSATTKSHRGSKDKELIRFGESDSHVRVYLSKEDVQHKIDLHLKKSKTKGVAVDGIPIHKSSELFGILNIVFFSPEDLSIIKNGPSERRRFIDLELCQLDKIYFYHLSKYNKIVNQRNNLLKQINFRTDLLETLDIWDEQLVKYGVEVIKRRSRFVDMINEIIGGIHQKLTGGREHLHVMYEASVPAEDFLTILKSKRKMDLKNCSTTVGPHRDDMSFVVDTIDIRRFGSQGQQRTAALSLKLSEIELVKTLIHDTPVLLLDDVLSELDSSRKNYLLDSIREVQTIITCTGLEEFIHSRLSIDHIYLVKQGTVTMEN